MTNETGTPDTRAPAGVAIRAEVLAATKGARTVVAPTDDGRDGAYRQGRAAAIALCAAHKAKLVLVDRATESWWIDPYGSGPFTADTDLYSHGERPLDRAELEALGHHDLVEQLDEAAAAGVEAAALLGRRPRFRTLRETLDHIPVDVVFAVDWLEHPDRAEQRDLRSGFLDRLREAAGSRTVVVLSADGTLRAYPPRLIHPHGPRNSRTVSTASPVTPADCHRDMERYASSPGGTTAASAQVDPERSAKVVGTSLGYSRLYCRHQIGFQRWRDRDRGAGL